MLVLPLEKSDGASRKYSAMPKYACSFLLTSAISRERSSSKLGFTFENHNRSLVAAQRPIGAAREFPRY